MRCAVCRKPLRTPAATRGHATFGPACARSLNLLPMRRRRRAAAADLTTTTPEVDPRQLDWVTLANEKKDTAA